jgi:hypothetical protein
MIEPGTSRILCINNQLALAHVLLPFSEKNLRIKSEVLNTYEFFAVYTVMLCVLADVRNNIRCFSNGIQTLMLCSCKSGIPTYSSLGEDRQCTVKFRKGHFCCFEATGQTKNINLALLAISPPVKQPLSQRLIQFYPACPIAKLKSQLTIEMFSFHAAPKDKYFLTADPSINSKTKKKTYFRNHSESLKGVDLLM